MRKKTPVASRGGGPTYIGTGMKIEGKIHCTGPIRIDGIVHGTIHCEGTIAIGATAEIVASLHTESAMVNGRVEGNIFVTEQLEVLPQGYILGNVSNPKGRLVIHEGAVIEGQCFSYDPTAETPQQTITTGSVTKDRLLEPA